MADRIHMTFTCNQDWDKMKISSTDRHCHLCSRVVPDFTGMPVSEIMARSKGQDLCGQFSIEQLDPDLVPLKWPRSLKAAMLAAGAVIGLETSHAQAQEIPDKPKTEISSASKGVPSDSVAMNQTVERTQAKVKKKDDSEWDPRRERRYYLSWRFPFVHKARIVRMGRYRY